MFQSSQIVSRSRSPRRSAPHTLHLLRLSLEPKARVRPRVGTSRLGRPFPSPPSAASAAALSWAILSASRAASSASGVSGIVSRLEMLGLRDLAEVGVEGTEDKLPEYRAELPSYVRYEGEDEMEDGVEGAGPVSEPELL
jgi:hypothetical protein